MNMRYIISIQGPMAVGKTTAIKHAEKQFRQFNFSYENPFPIVTKRDKLGLDITTETGFVEDQRLFIEAEIKRYNALPNGVTVFDRGPEDTECYTINHPKVIGEQWDIEEALQPELSLLRNCVVDSILFLTASDEVLSQRMSSDKSRRRSSFNLKAFRLYEKWYRNKSNVDFLDVTKLTPQAQATQVREWVKQRVENRAHC